MAVFCGVVSLSLSEAMMRWRWFQLRSWCWFWDFVSRQALGDSCSNKNTLTDLVILPGFSIKQSLEDLWFAFNFICVSWKCRTGVSLPPSNCAERCPVELYWNYQWFKAEMSDLRWADGEQNWNDFREVRQELEVQPCSLWVSSQGSSSNQHEFCNVTEVQTLAQGILSTYEKEVHGHPQLFWQNLLSYFDMWWWYSIWKHLCSHCPFWKSEVAWLQKGAK